MNYVLGGHSIGGVLGRTQGAAVPWYLAGGAPMPVAAYQPIGAASLAASYTNLAAPGTYDAAPGVAPTWAAATGWTFSAAQYLATGSTGVLPGTWSFVLRFAASARDSRYVAGTHDGTSSKRLWMQLFPAGVFGPDPTNVYAIGSGAVIASALDSGVACVAGLSVYHDGTYINVASGTMAAATNPWYIGNRAASTSFGFPGSIAALAIYDVTLSAAQVAAISAAMAAL